jgi:UDP-glucose 4-epimerase/UDP-glucuronate 4-epimerase
MTVLVTGAAGFLGQRVTADLRGDGIEVVGLDVVPGDDDDVLVEAVDVQDRGALGQLMRDHGVRSVVHAGGISGPHVANDEPALVAAVNIVGTTTLLECARELPLPGRIVLLSSSSVYGEAAEAASRQRPCVETLALLASEPYGASKVGSEAMLRAYVEHSDVDAVALRVSIVYGAGRRTYCGITAMIHQAMDSGTIVLDRDSDVPLPWIYVTDVISAVRTALDAPRASLRNEGTYAFNLTGPGFPTFRQIAATIADAIPGTSVVQGDDLDKYGMNARTMSLTAIERELGWKPHVTIDDGVRLLLDSERVRRGA